MSEQPQDGLSERIQSAENANVPPNNIWRSDNYHMLKSSDTRLLYLKVDKMGHIHGSLRIVPIAETHVEYIAISYCWETGSQPQIIQIDGHQMQISGNLYCALKHLHKIDNRPVWADAICINQSDDDEKAKQVGRMGEIYSKATWTAVWLGEEAHDSTKVMEMLSQDPRVYSEALLLLKIAVHDPGSQDSAITSFFNRPYWKRTWVIQEIALSQHPYLLCENAPKVDWEYLRTIVLRTNSVSTVQTGWLNDIHDLLTIRGEFRQSNSRRDFLQLLLHTRNALATLLRDKVYALLGIACDGDYFIDEPSYARSNDGRLLVSDNDVCRGIVETFIRRTSSLDIILFGSSVDVTNSLSTWCAEFLNVAAKPLSQDLVDYISNSLANEGPTWKTTQSSRVSNPLNVLRPKELHIEARGFQLGTIYSQGVKSVFDKDEQFPVIESSNRDIMRLKDKIKVNSFLQLLIIFCPKYNFYSLNPLTLRSLFQNLYFVSKFTGNWHLLVTQNLDMQLFGKSLRDLLNEVWSLDFNREQVRRAGVNSLVIPSPLRDNSPIDADNLKVKQPNMAYDRDELEVRDSMMELLYRTEREKLRLTSMYSIDNCWLGFGPVDARPGDHVFLLEGCSLPIVLRAVEGLEQDNFTNNWDMLMSRRYRIIGHAYIEGVMFGEEWQRRESQLYNIPIF
jgi:Heterokaryon incompatibility protein (HET)